jgi:uncharacterized protein (TIGR02217 family)
MTFHDIRFPLDIALNSEGGPTRRTEIVALVSGREERNSPASGSRRSFNAGYGVKSLADIEAVIAFFEARRGRLHAFRFRDPFDWKSCSLADTPQTDDQTLGQGDGARRAFPLIKRYVSGAQAYERAITRPVAGTLRIAVGGAETTAFTLSGGVVTLSTAPAIGAVVTAGFEFDMPARFDTDSLRVNLAAFRAGDIPSIPIIEVLE